VEGEGELGRCCHRRGLDNGDRWVVCCGR
jgi:hypothetical protein